MDQEQLNQALQAQDKNLVQVRPELQPSKNCKALAVALRSATLDRCYDENIGQVLKYVMLKLGIRAQNMPDKFEFQILINHVKTNYPNNCVDELRLAFDMAINEELDMNPDDIKCYENFSCAYISRIMNAYVSWAASEIKFIRHEPPPQKIYTDEENDNLHRELTELFYQRLRNGYAGEMPDYVYPILVKDGLIKEGDSPVSFMVYKLGIQQKNIYTKQ